VVVTRNEIGEAGNSKMFLNKVILHKHISYCRSVEKPVQAGRTALLLSLDCRWSGFYCTSVRRNGCWL